MAVVERISRIDSNLTALTSDYDFSAFEAWITNNASGVMFSDMTTKAELALSGTSGTVTMSPGKAVIQVTRATSSPIANEKVNLLYELSETKSLSVTSGDKIYIEVDQTLVDTPTSIEDTYPSTTYAQGKGIAELKASQSYPGTNTYLPLYTSVGYTWTDVRTSPKVEADRCDLSEIKDQTRFSTYFPTTPTAEPTTSYQVTNKLYVDSQIVSASVGFVLGDASDGALVVSAGTTNLTAGTVYNYSSISISGGATLGATGTGEVVLRSKGTTTIDGTISLVGTGSGTTFRSTIVGDLSYGASGSVGAGGNGGAGGGTGGSAGTGNPTSGHGGGGGGGKGSGSNGGNGGNGGTPAGTGGTAGSGGTPGGAGGNSAGGGGGGGGTPSSGAVGGNAYSNNGSNVGSGPGGGGGGAGGNVGTEGGYGGGLIIYTYNFSGSGTINCNGGNGGTGGNGGNGGNAFTTGGYGGGGGGGGGGGKGGGGGAVCLLSFGSTFGGSITVAGGSGGSGGSLGAGSVSGSGAGANGVAGSSGTSGASGNSTNSYIYDLVR